MNIDLMLEAGELAIVERLVVVKRAGGDCTEDDSAWIKGYFDTHHPEGKGHELSSWYPLETDEWFDETERGLR